MRRRLAALSVQSVCFYCGLPFNINPLHKGEPKSRKFARYARMTLEHLNAVANGGETSEENCVLAHCWCNSRVNTLPLAEKLLWRETLMLSVAENNSLPWSNAHTYSVEMPRTSSKAPKPRKPKINGKKAMKDAMREICDRCYYCNMPFELVPISEGEPFNRKFKSYARMMIEPLTPAEDAVVYDSTNSFLAHQWCRNKAMHLSPEEKAAFKIAMTTKCANGDMLPWIDKKMLKGYLAAGGNLLQFLERMEPSKRAG